MKFGIALSTGYEGLIYPIPFNKPKELPELVKIAEDLGFDSVLPNDHFTVQKYVEAKWHKTPNYYEPLITLAAGSAITRKIQLITGIIVLPYRDPLLLAKQAATLDQISGGRFILGVGLGAYREEFVGVHPQWKDMSRAELMEESLTCLRKIFTEDTSTFKGKFFQFENVKVNPKPLQKPFPIWLGGNSEKEMERTARYGNGWLPACLSPQAIKDRMVRLKSYFEREGRKFEGIEIAPQLFSSIGKNKQEAMDKLKNSGLYDHVVSLKSSTLKNDNIQNLEDFNLIGDGDDIIAKVKEYEAAGVTHITGLSFPVKDTKDLIKQMEIFSKQVITRYK